jgi:hypothetical protein
MFATLRALRAHFLVSGVYGAHLTSLTGVCGGG